ncbi:MAG: phosphotransferase family protein [bacterium]|nr:phosphotransferase family protein [Deltaproteobacteria bacterium]MCP4907836.1 phosphotransferase family protein [bacterium]
MAPGATPETESGKPPLIRTGIQEVDPRHEFDVGKLEEYIRANLAAFEGGLVIRQFVGGQSNPTYLLSDGSREWVLRRKPPGKLVSSAHATDREFRVLSALGKTDFPVPRVLFYCDDESVIGTEFYLMDRVVGRILVDQTLPDWEPEERRSLYESQIQILAKLHQVDHQAIGLGDYGKPGNYFARQIHVWSKQALRSFSEEGDSAARCASMERLMEWLPENIPEDPSTTIVHGDYGLNNMVLHPDEGRVVAILDWELSTLGHPFADLTYHLSQRLSPNGPFARLDDADLAAMGIPTQDEYVARYCELTGRTGIENLNFYLAFQLFRLAGIMFGIAGRARAGTAAGAQAMEFGKNAAPLADRGLELARRLGA